MKGEPKSYEMALQPLPQVIVSVRDMDGRNNALAVGYTANVSRDPEMVMVGIEPTRFSHHMVKENGCFVVNLPLKSFRKGFGYLGSKSGRDGDKFAALDLNGRTASM
jgi:flavin reductase (DIM6/NTAB) family NADH-FMN oxidoreductase RutF